jgi:uncharacterized protein (TIGR03118 family)
MKFSRLLIVPVAAALGIHAAHAANAYVQHNLVSDLNGVADKVDPNLVNPWGIATSATSPFWVSNNHSGTITVYDSSGNPFPAAQPLVVTLPTAANGNTPSSPTAQIANDTGGFALADGKPASFLFVSEDGVVAAWNGSSGGTANIMVDKSTSGVVYKGAAAANAANGPQLYAANFHDGTVDVFDTNFNSITTPGGFMDPNVPAGFAPFGIQRIGRKLYVTYAMQDEDRHDDVAGPGNGFVNVFDFDGNLLGRLASNGALNSPWAVVMAPANFGDLSYTLLVGNFGDGTINAYDSCSGQWLATLNDAKGAPISIPGLWGLLFGNGHNGGDAATLYFTAGIAGPDDIEDHGLLGSLAVTTPASAPGPTNQALNIANFAFVPDPVTVGAGSTLVWTNQDGTTHTVVADDGSFRSSGLAKDATFSMQLNTPGTYPYHCSIHPFMKGTITVK